MMIRILKICLEIIGWIQIAFGTTMVATLIAWLVYIQFDNYTGKIISLAIICIGFLTGAFWATKILLKHGTINWLSQIRKIK